MDENIKQVLSFLLEQENLRAQEMKALNDKIDSLFSIVDEKVLEYGQFADDINFDKFNSKYGEQLGQYSDVMKRINQDDGYDVIRDTFDEMKNHEDVDADTFVSDVTTRLDAYLSALGIPADTKVEVVADLDGDGETETVVDSTDEKVADVDAGAESDAEAADKINQMGVIEEAYKADGDAKKAEAALKELGYSDEEVEQLLNNWDEEIADADYMKSINDAVDAELKK